MTDNVVPFPGLTTVEIPAETILEMARKADLKCMLVFGVDADGNEHLLATTAEASRVIFMCERARHQMHGLIDNHMAGHNNGKR